MYGRYDPSSSGSKYAPPAPGRWRCPECGAWNDPDNINAERIKQCFSCDALEERP
jgi:hypothetical protein